MSEKGASHQEDKNRERKRNNMSKQQAIRNAVRAVKAHGFTLPVDLEKQIAGLENPQYRVAVVGEYHVGKSALINRVFCGDKIPLTDPQIGDPEATSIATEAENCVALTKKRVHSRPFQYRKRFVETVKGLSMKGLLILAMAVIVPLYSLAGFRSWASKTETKTIDGVEYFYIIGGDRYRGDAILENNNSCAVNISDDRKVLVIPDALGKRQVSAISDRACANLIELEEIRLPKKLKFIGYSAFEGCTSLKSLIIPSSVKEIGQGAFKDCEKLSTINLPMGVRISSFKDCTGLEKIDISCAKFASLSGMFMGCTSLKHVKLPKNLKFIDNGAFMDCKSLKSIELPVRIEKIGSSAFAGCSQLSSIKLPETVMKIEHSAFEGCSSLRRIEIPYRVGGIESGVFAECSSLETITIPENVTYIGPSAFANCTSLKEIVMSSSVKNVNRSAFWGCKNIKVIKVPASMKDLISELEIAPGVKRIKDMTSVKILILE